MEHLFEEMAGEQSKRVVVAVGRMNPPTIGHYKVIDAMKEFIRKNKDLKLDPTPVVVIVEGKETSKDKSKNPLTGEERIKFMEASGKANGVKFLIASNAFSAFAGVRDAGYEPIAIAAGSDRISEYLKMLDKHFKAKDGSDIKHVAVPALDRVDVDTDDGPEAFEKIIDEIADGGDVPVSMVSASLTRYAAKMDNLDAFAYLTGLTAKKALAKRMMQKIKDAQSA